MDISKDLLNQVKGFLAEEEGQCLYQTALDVGSAGPCLEIGSYCGKSTIYLGMACKQKDSILFSVDHHRGSEEQQPGEEYFDPDLFDSSTGQVDTFSAFRKTLALAGLEDTVVPMVCRSAVAAHSWATPLSLIFIDGGHGYQSVYWDYLLWSPHLIFGGFLMFHDIYEKPHQGGQAPHQIYQMALASGRYDPLPRIRSLGILKCKLHSS